MITLEKEILHVHPHDEFTIYYAETFLTTLLPLISSAKSLHVNLSDTDKIDTAGFQILIALKKSCEAFNIPFSIEGIQNSCENFMALFGYDFDVDAKGVA